MAEYMLHLKKEETVTLGADVVRRLVEGGDGDAALLYLCLASHGSSEPEKLREELKWGMERYTAAERALRAMGLVSAPAEEAEAKAPAPPLREPETAIPEYSSEDVIGKLENDQSFSALLREVERKLGRLSDPSVKKLLGLYDYLGLPTEVIFLLVGYCAERKAEQFGVDKPPTMREIEKEGYAWARRELFSIEAADAYIQSERKRRGQFPEYMEALQLGTRALSPGEERYLSAWVEMGFPAETVAIAYDKTMLNCHELKWPYLNSILKRWHEKGVHTPKEAESALAAPKRQSAMPQVSSDRNAWMKDYD